ncbi:MAG TPA: class I SAM-dependent methyltransferase [Zeimonas sp.]
MAIDADRLDALMGKLVNEFGAIASAPLVVLGDRLGLFRALSDGGPTSADDFAERTGVRARYAREWLNGMAASGYIDYDADDDAYSMSEEAAAVFVDENSPTFLCGGFEIFAALAQDLDKLQRAFTSGSGLGWHEHSAGLYSGTERFFRPGYNAHLVPEWIPALTGVEAKLRDGARVADVGCGYGSSTIVMAKAYPNSEFFGYDYHPQSIDAARARAAEAGVDDRVHFERAGAKDYPAQDFDLVAFFDCLHDLGDPVGAARHVRETLADDGSWLIVEPFAADTVAENLNPVGRVYYCASTMICTPCSLSQEVGLGLGAQAGERRLRNVAEQAGFAQFRRTSQTPFNMVFEARA